jgi:hypothetical protein
MQTSPGVPAGWSSAAGVTITTGMLNSLIVLDSIGAKPNVHLHLLCVATEGGASVRLFPQRPQ